MRKNPLDDGSDYSRIIPPKDKAERQEFWIAHGNASLREKGMGNLQWICTNGSYSIRAAMIAPIEAGTAETSGSARRARAGSAPDNGEQWVIEDA